MMNTNKESDMFPFVKDAHVIAVEKHRCEMQFLNLMQANYATANKAVQVLQAKILNNCKGLVAVARRKVEICTFVCL